MTEYRFVFRGPLSQTALLECLRYSSGSVDRFEVQGENPSRLIVYVLPPSKINRTAWFQMNMERAKRFGVVLEKVPGI